MTKNFLTFRWPTTLTFDLKFWKSYTMRTPHPTWMWSFRTIGSKLWCVEQDQDCGQSHRQTDRQTHRQRELIIQVFKHNYNIMLCNNVYNSWVYDRIKVTSTKNHILTQMLCIYFLFMISSIKSCQFLDLFSKTELYSITSSAIIEVSNILRAAITEMCNSW